jgi:HAD superfamily hydrolase (TIGR01509 family)
MAYPLVIFDCDGVMFDSRLANEAFYNHIRQSFGLPPMDLKEVEYVHMATADQSIDHIMPEHLRDQAQKYRLNVDYARFYDQMIVEPDLKTVLAELKENDRRIALFTNRSNTIGPLLDAFDLAPYFELVISSQDVDRPKPHPEGLYKILERFQTPSGRALFIGDSPSDAAAASAAGVPLAAYRNPNLDAAHHIQRLGELTEIV